MIPPAVQAEIDAYFGPGLARENVLRVCKLAVRETARDLLSEFREQSHYECEDPWYSCPKSDGGCADDRQKGCMCGADEYNAEIARLRARYGIKEAT